MTFITLIFVSNRTSSPSTIFSTVALAPSTKPISV